MTFWLSSQVFRQRVGEFAIRLDVEDAMVADDVGNSVEAALGADVRAVELTQEELAVVAEAMSLSRTLPPMASPSLKL